MENETKIGRPTLVVAAVVAAVVAGIMFVISAPEEPAVRPQPTETPTPTENPVVTFGVWGTDAEIAAYQEAVDAYNETTVVVEATLASWSDSAAMLADLESGAADPDVFLLPREDLGATMAADRNRPVLDLLDARGVSVGDDYFRSAITAFSAEDALQCMPWTSSPMVIYYNTDLIDFDQMREQGLPVPRESDGRWSLDAFEEAARVATRPRRGTRGFAIEPTLEGLAPFLLSGGGSLFDADEPTSLALGDDASAGALTETLTVLRESQYTLTDEQLERRTPLEWFQRGRVGMIAGYRDLVPLLRETEDLNFDVLPMPRLGNNVTTGKMTGLCVAEGPQDEVDRAADFLVHLTSSQEVTDVTVATGSLAPADQQVAFSPEYLQPDLQPARSTVFTDEQRYIALPPLLESWEELEALAADDLATLLTTPVLTPEEIQEALIALDEESRALMDPDYEPDESESESESDADSGTSGGDS